MNVNGYNKNEDTETYIVSDYKAEDENTHHSGGTKGHAMEEDEDEEEAGHHKAINCQNQ